MAKIKLRLISGLCHRVAIGLDAGIDVRRIWNTEADNAVGPMRDELRQIADRIGRGEELTDALRASDGFFPPLMCEIVEIGEQSGRLEQAFHRLSEHYSYTLRMRRNFWTGIAWPLTELGIAIFVVGVVIWILGAIGGQAGEDKVTFMGLSGTSGLLKYLTFVTLVGGTIALGITAVVKQWFNTEPIFQLMMRIPGLSGMLQTMALSRLTWSLSMAVESGLDPDRCVDLAVRSTHNTFYTAKLSDMRSMVRHGNEIHEAFRMTQRYPVEFLDALESGDVSGNMGKAMEVLTREYEERTKVYMRGLTVAASMTVFFIVAGIIIFMIFNMVSIYLNPINKALGR